MFEFLLFECKQVWKRRYFAIDKIKNGMEKKIDVPRPIIGMEWKNSSFSGMSEWHSHA